MERDAATGDDNLGFGYGTGDGYLTGNDSNQPDSPDVLQQSDTAIVPEDLPTEEEYGAVEPGEGDNAVGLGEATGTERFDQDPRDSQGVPHDQAAIGDADLRTTESVYAQWEQGRRQDDLP